MLIRKNVGIFLFHEVEVLDFAGPFEVFSLTEFPQINEKAFTVKTVSQDGGLIKARNGLTVQPDYSFVTAPSFDILIIPGGYGAEMIEIHNAVVIRWIQEQYSRVELLASVCTGALLLAKAGLLDGKSATTHWMDIPRLAAEFPNINVLSNTRYVDEGRLITSGGISSGIHMSLHVIRRLISEEASIDTARRMEYDITGI